jgi:hypothetical protein
MVLQQISAMSTMRYYQDPAFAGVWSKVMMPSAGPPPLAFLVVSLFFSYATGATLAAVYDFVNGLFGKSYWAKVVGFTDIIVGLAIVLGFFPMYLLFNLPLALLAWWVGTSWVVTLLTAMAFAKTIK